jgi:signal transduction histidine kinase
MTSFIGIKGFIGKVLVFTGLFAGVYAILALSGILGSILPGIIVITVIFRPLEDLLIRATDKYFLKKESPRKKQFKELTTDEAAQKEKMAVIGTLSAGINHEICNPLGIARGQCEAFLLNMKDGIYEKMNPDELLLKAQQVMTKVIRETDRATAITKKLSSFAKPAKGDVELIDVGTEIDEVFALVSYELRLEKISLEKNIAEGLPRILVDKKQFQEILFNLLRNACQAIGDRGKISVAAQESGGKVVVDIHDTGSGIDQNKVKELFNPFFTTKDPGKGTGLGLFIVRQVVEKNGGRIYMKDTKVGQGTTFTIEFPVSGHSCVEAS